MDKEQKMPANQQVTKTPDNSPLHPVANGSAALAVTVAKVKHFAAMSEETNCFVCDILIDGKKVGDARNEGHGGMTIISPYSLAERLDAYAKTLPDYICEDGMALKMGGDFLIDTLVEDFLRGKTVARWMASKVLFTRDGEKGVRTLVSSIKGPAGVAAMLAKLATPEGKAKWRVGTILNGLPLAEAVAIAKQHGAV